MEVLDPFGEAASIINVGIALEHGDIVVSNSEGADTEVADCDIFDTEDERISFVHAVDVLFVIQAGCKFIELSDLALAPDAHLNRL